jgi:hypothetical protein
MLKPLNIIGGNVSSETTIEISMESHQKKKIDWSYDPAIPLLGIYQKKCESAHQTDTCILMFSQYCSQ